MSKDTDQRFQQPGSDEVVEWTVRIEPTENHARARRDSLRDLERPLPSREREEILKRFTVVDL